MLLGALVVFSQGWFTEGGQTTRKGFVLLVVAIALFATSPMCLAQKTVLVIGKDTYAELNALAEWTGSDAALFLATGEVVMRRDREAISLKLTPGSAGKAAMATKVGNLYYVNLRALPGSLGVSARIVAGGMVHVAFGDETDFYEIPQDRPVKKNHIRIAPAPSRTALQQVVAARKLLNTRMYDEALKELGLALKSDPDYTEAELAMAEAYRAMDDKPNARKHLQRVMNGVASVAQLKLANALASSLRNGPTKADLAGENADPVNTTDSPRIGRSSSAKWICRDAFMDMLRDNQVVYSVSTFVFNEDGTGTFRLVPPNSEAPIIYSLEWATEEQILILDFHPTQGDTRRSWPARLRWSLSDDGMKLALTGRNDIRESYLTMAVEGSQEAADGGVNVGELLYPRGNLDTAVYRRQ